MYEFISKLHNSISISKKVNSSRFVTKTDIIDFDTFSNENYDVIPDKSHQHVSLNKLTIEQLTELCQKHAITPSTEHQPPKKMSNIGNLFGFGDKSTTSESLKNDSNVGKATAEAINQTTKTLDGFGKINDIPIDFASSSSSRMTEQEKRKKKRLMIKKLEEWYEKGLVKQSSHFTMESNYSEIEDEYEACLEDKKTKDSIKLQQWWFMTFVNSIEYANTVFDPFGLNLDGWGEQVNEDIESYDEIFTELHHKYKGGKLSPELSLLLRLGFSAAVVNITNKALSTSTPGFNDIIKQSPELMKMFTNATVQSLNSQNQNTASSFMNNVLNNTGQPTVNNSFGPPPPAVQN